MTKFKLELARVLQALDKRDKDFYNKLTKEEQQAFQPYVLLRYMSSVPDNKMPEIALVATNEIVNMDFWDLSKETELQAKLLAVCGLGQKQYHKWIPLKNKKTNNLTNFIKEIFALKNWTCNNFEVEVFIQHTTEDDLRKLCHEFAKSKDDEKKIIDDYKKTM